VSSEKPFVPQFGPNGAVINSPDMSDKMRAEIEESQKRPVTYLRREFSKNVLPSLVYIVCAALFFVFGIPLAQRMIEQGNLAGMMAVSFLGIPGMFFIAMLVIGLAAANLRRWEIVGVPPAERRLPASFGIRVSLCLAELALQLLVVAGIPLGLLNEETYLLGFAMVAVGWLGQFGLSRLAFARGWRCET
jgi:hypothetical protein